MRAYRQLTAEILISKLGCSKVCSKGTNIFDSIIFVINLSGPYYVYSNFCYSTVKMLWICY